MSTLIVRKIESSRDIQRFLQLPWALYQDDPQWSPPVLAEMRMRLNPKKNPYFEHAEAAMFLAERDGIPVGRITAQVCQLAQIHQQAGDGHFGFFECEDSQATADALFAAAADWLRQRGMKRMLGPFNLSINEEAGLLVDGFHRPPYVFMAHSLPRYQHNFDQAGFAKEVDLYAYLLEVEKAFPDRIERIIHSAARDPRIKLRTVNQRNLEAELHQVLSIFNEAWSNNWGHIPMTEAEVDDMAMMVRRLFGTDSVVLAEVGGEVAGFIVAIANLNELTADLDGRLFPLGWLKLLYRMKFGSCPSVRVPLMGIRPQYQSSRTGAAITFAMIDFCRQAYAPMQVKHCEMSWILETNSAMRGILEAAGSTLDKTYRIYSKPIV
ncbi:N-acetyltransferase [Rubripirellula lacrimiformis]|nr:N-acetyltransferase [Rubripirellula lacrimiformis]